MSARGLLIAAPRSGSGKTTITLGLQRALTQRGLTVRGLKCGPDYIDPAFHAAATGAPSANLDSYAMTDGLLGRIAGEAADAADIVIAEGSMGLFDAVPGPEGHTGAGADIAALTGWPVALVIDVSGAAQSVAAVALGCKMYDPRIRVVGVILNKVASARHERLVRQGMERIGLPVLVALPREASLILPERHLGLVQAGETADLHARLDALAEAVSNTVDLDAVVAAAGATMFPAAPDGETPPLPAPGRRIAIARDAAFSFVYPHVETGWRAAGAQLLPFSPLKDEAPPESCDACWLPGGYPELHAGTIATADRFLEGLRSFAETRPVHGECGGYMVLGRTLTDADGVTHAMAGLLSVETSFAKRKMNLGYRRAVLEADGPLGPAGSALTGHEFHYASIVAQGDDPPFAVVTDPHGSPPVPTGSRRGLVTGSFFHAIATAGPGVSQAPVFDAAFARQFEELLRWRRDVRRFKRDAVPAGLIETLLAQTKLSPSVGHAQPWRWVAVTEPAQRAAVQQSFGRCNADALASYEGERATLYARLKLEGLREAPVQFAVFCDHGTARGHGLGRATMPEMLDYSVVAAITQFWLSARIHGLGVGWVSILDPGEIAEALEAPPAWKLVAYLCVGWPEEECDEPELVRAGWERG